MSTDLEIRFTTADDLEIRAGENDSSKLIGYAIRWGDLSADLGGFKERVMKGAVSATLAAQTDIRALVSHDPEKLLGRTSNRTLTVTEDDKGVRVEIDVAPTTYGRDLMTLVKRGDIKKMSFGFTVPDGGQRFLKDNGVAIRELTAINLREVSAVANPAYGTTSLSIRVDPSVRQYLDWEFSRPIFAKCAAKFRNTIVNG
jgi:HK97 family phage prohead protease